MVPRCTQCKCVSLIPYLKCLFSTLRISVDEAGFQAAAAAAAAAAASLCGGDGPSDEQSDGGQYPISDSSSGLINVGNNSRPSIMRSLNDINEYPKYGWVDITDQFMSACGELNLGELAQDVFFGLFDAMSAIEMMDPKMDVGMGYNRKEAPPHTFQSAAEVTQMLLIN